jgi:hypothetical protein
MTHPLEQLAQLFGSQSQMARAAGVTPTAISLAKRYGMADSLRWKLLGACRENGLPVEVYGPLLELPEEKPCDPIAAAAEAA